MMSEMFCPHCGGLHDPNMGSCPESPLASRTLPGGFRVLERLGETSFGVFYRAEYLDSHDEVEVLILHPESTSGGPTAETRGIVNLRDQLHRATRIKHPNVANVTAMGETEEGTQWVAFEVLRGELLSKMLSAREPLPPKGAIDLILQAASGLQAAHEVGLVHGNLSPDTIFVTRTAGNRALVKIIRFGLGQHWAEPSAADGQSSSYAAPERFAGHPPDERSDVFSLGAVLQHLLTGALPSAGADQAVPISEAARRVLAKALEPAPDDRFQTVAAFARALATATSRPPARIRSGEHRAGRLRGVLAVALVVAITIPWLWRSIERTNLGKADDGVMAAGEPIITGEIREPPLEELDSTPMGLHKSRSDNATDPPPASSTQRGSVNSGRPVGSARTPAASSPGPDDRAASNSMLFDVRWVDSTIQVDLRYATANNFTGAPLPGYDATRALLRREAAAALGRVQARLRSKGLGLRVFDAYRPVRASRAMVDWAERAGRRELVESGYIPRRSRHNLGVAVDLTLVDLATGTEVPMGTTFDNFTAAQRTDVNAEALRHRQMLAEAMKSEGFSAYGPAWWHFNYPVEGARPLDRVIR
jgi:D-alanyl-D-alanine dipeptidase